MKQKRVTQDTSAYSNYMNYLKGVDTSNVDTTLNNLTSYAKNASKKLGNKLGDYTFSVDGSDDARRRAEQATYNSYLQYLQPQFERQTADYSTMLQNKGLPVGSEAYERAMSDLQSQQNAALTQAAYLSVLNGQNAYSQSLGDEVTSGQFGNAAQQNYVNQIYSTLRGSPSEYENQQNLFSVGAGKSAIDYQNSLATAKGGWSGALTGGIQGGAQGAAQGFAAGGPWGAVAGGIAGTALGGYSGYYNNPYQQQNTNTGGTGMNGLGMMGMMNMFGNTGGSK